MIEGLLSSCVLPGVAGVSGEGGQPLATWGCCDDRQTTAHVAQWPTCLSPPSSAGLFKDILAKATAIYPVVKAESWGRLFSHRPPKSTLSSEPTDSTSSLSLRCHLSSFPLFQLRLPHLLSLSLFLSLNIQLTQ